MPLFGRNNPDNRELLNNAAENSNEQEQKENEQVIEPEKEERDDISNDDVKQEKAPNIVDGWRIIERENLPFNGKFYPESWNFAYRCPTAKEVVNFSTVNQRDYVSIYNAVEDIFKKCIKIWDSVKEKEIPIGEINDGDRYFFMVHLRDLYIPDPSQSLKIPYICPVCLKESEQIVKPEKLIFQEPTEELLEAYDGRVFTLEFGEKVVKVRIPTINTSGRLFKFVNQSLRDEQQGKNEGRQDTKMSKNKIFLKIAPFLFESGRETIHDIVNKFKQIEKDDDLVAIYASIADNINIQGEEYIISHCPHCDGEDTIDLTFPDWSKWFNKIIDNKGYFKNI